ncbi:MAG TPA: DUF4032 domain-containing protein [Dermacoccus sp.]|nr:DUF4032 domain-containing protein [Dermacoccus sp.]
MADAPFRVRHTVTRMRSAAPARWEDDEVALDIKAARPYPALFALPWSVPLEQWPEDQLAALPRGISRHIVRFAKVDGRILAVKEIKADIALREYAMLKQLRRLHLPCVEAIAVVTGRTDVHGEPLDACLLTRHLQFSLPYRAMISQSLRPDAATRLIDALAVLLVKVHLVGFWWGDVSLSNALFRRDAGEFAAYLVDAETGELREKLSKGQREHDLDIARVNIAGELMDLQAGGMVPDDMDPIEVSNTIVERYHELWEALTQAERFDASDAWRVEQRIRSLNDLGFDVGELDITTDIDGTTMSIKPQIVEAGYHTRRLRHLTGLEVGENQARRLLNDLVSFTASKNRQNDDERAVAHDWLATIYEPITRTAPPQLRQKLEPAEMFHEVLEHRWYMSERLQRHVTIEEAVADYVENILPTKPDEQNVIAPDATPLQMTAR